MLTGHHIARECGTRPILIDISADANNVNIFTLAGSPGSAVVCVCTILPGVWLGSTSVATPSLRTGAFVAGSRLYIIPSFSYVAGRGGAAALSGPENGGDALYLDCDAIVDITNGYLLGGGGGGRTGPKDGSGLSGSDGGGGGGGQGNPGGAYSALESAGGGASGANGTAGSRAAYGTGGAPGVNSFYGTFGGKGSRGGGWGEGGPDTGANSTGFYRAGTSQGGYAVRLNGKTLTWVGSPTSDRVKGLVA